MIYIPSARKLIYLLLFESGLLSAATLHNHIIFLFALKMGGPDTIRKVLRSNFYPKLEALGDIDELYDNPMTYMSLVNRGLDYFEYSVK